MIFHLFKLIWNKKRQNFLLIIEMFVSFIVVFAVFTFLVYSYKNYREPEGFDHRDVWVVNYSTPEGIQQTDSAILFYETLKQLLRSMPQIEEISLSGNNFPFSSNENNTSTRYGNKEVHTNIFNGEDTYAKVLNLHLVQGRWFAPEDKVSTIPVVVINEKLKESLFGNEDAVGKIIGGESDRLKVVGVIRNMKDKSAFEASRYGMYRRTDTGWYRWTTNMLLKVRPRTDAAFESQLYKTLSDAFGTSIEIEHLDKMRARKNELMLVPMIIVAVVAGFLICNVALGLFGVLWYNINKRRAEIGLRRAIGASGKAISLQLVGEAMVLATISLILGCFFAVQFPLLNVFDLPAGLYVIAIALAVVFMYTLVAVCAVYPGKQAAAIYPAVALHEE